MESTFFILAINPGATSTEFGLFENSSPIWIETIQHSEEISLQPLSSQLHLRHRIILDRLGPSPTLNVIAARGGPLKPLSGGTYAINKAMLQDYLHETYSSHASNLGALIAHEISQITHAPAFIVDPVTTDEFIPESRISGVPGIERKSRSHALNIKFCARKTASTLGIQSNQSRFIVAHLGSGFSIAAVRHLQIIDVNDALLGMGPFSIQRAGALPLAGILDLIYHDKKSRKECEHILSKESGLAGYVGTYNFKDIEQQLDDPKIHLIYSAMIHQISKEIGAMFAVLDGNVNGLIFTGGLAHSSKLMNDIQTKVAFAHPIFIYPGSFELKALVQGVIPICMEHETPKEYL